MEHPRHVNFCNVNDNDCYSKSSLDWIWLEYKESEDDRKFVHRFHEYNCWILVSSFYLGDVPEH